MFVIALPMFWIIRSPAQELDIFCSMGGLIWILGFFFESISDRQLREFKKNPENKGKLMTSGLWAWSRHPNYFGEVVQWWGVFLFAASLPMGWVTIISPVTITFFILKVSGVPLLEEQMKSRPGAAEYRRTTSVFFPRPPKKQQQQG